MKHSNSFWKRTIIGCSLLGMVIVTALPAQAAVQAATLNERTVSAVSTYTGTNVALATSKTAAINTATSTTNTTTNDATLTASKTTAKKAALNKTSLKLKKGKTYQLNIVRLLQIWRRARIVAERRPDLDVHRFAGSAADDPQHVQDLRRAASGRVPRFGACAGRTVAVDFRRSSGCDGGPPDGFCHAGHLQRLELLHW